MNEIRVSVLSTTPVVVPYATLDGAGVLSDPTGTTAEFAFTALDVDPVGGDWNDGTWQTWSNETVTTNVAGVVVQTPYRAQYDVVGATLGVGTWMGWLRVGSYVEKVGKVTVYE